MARASLREGRWFRRKASYGKSSLVELIIWIRNQTRPHWDKHRLFEEIILVYYVYILQSLKTKKLYIGHTDELARRVREHNTGRGGRYTRQNEPWTLLYSESYPDRPSATKRERYLKSTQGSQEKKKLAGVLK